MDRALSLYAERKVESLCLRNQLIGLADCRKTLQQTRLLKRMGIEVYFTEDGIWTMNDEDGELRLTIMATLAQNESKKTSMRVKAGQMVSFQNGVIYGTGNVLGYDKVGPEYVINEAQAKTVRKIFDMYLAGNGSQKIKRQLEKDGDLTAMGKSLWHYATISHILKNRLYCGELEYRKEYVPDYLEQKRAKNNGELDRIIVAGKHQPIVSKEEFERVQKLIEEKRPQMEKCRKNKGVHSDALYNLVDAYFVGGLGESPMGAISVVFPLGQVVVGVGLMFGNGAASYLSRLLGQGDRNTANRVASTALYSSVLIGGVLIAFAAVFLRPILVLLGATDTIMPYALIYGRIYVISCIFNVCNVTMNNIVASEGAAKTTMTALLLGAVLNIGLDPVFIYVLDMGVAGAAIATAISQAVSTLVYLLYVLRKKSAFTFRLQEFKPTRQIYAEILKIGIPTLTFQLLTSLSIALVNRAANGYGDAVIAGMGAVTRITSMGTLVVFGFLKGFQPIAGFSYGAKKFDRLREAVKTSILWSSVFCILVGLLMALFSTQIISQFANGNSGMIAAGRKSLFANGLSFFLFGFYTVYSSLFLALGKGIKGFLLGACRQGICFVPVILLLPKICGINGILYAQPIADVFSAVITIFMAWQLHRELRVTEEQISHDK